MPKVSVIIPVYNVENYLRQCLDSVVNQTLKEIEIICVDDGSTDDSFDILQEYAEKDARIKVVKQKNQGVGFSRNKGIKLANGEFVCFLDSDDYYQYDNNLELLYTKSKTNNALICGGEFSLLCDEKIYQEEEKLFYGYNFKKEGFIEHRYFCFNISF